MCKNKNNSRVDRIMDESIKYDLAKARGQLLIIYEVKKDLDWKEREIKDLIKELEKELK